MRKNVHMIAIITVISIICSGAIVVDPTKKLDPENIFIIEKIGDFYLSSEPNSNVPNQIYHHHGAYFNYYFYDYQERYGYRAGYKHDGLENGWNVCIFPTKQENYLKHDILLHVVSLQQMSVYRERKDPNSSSYRKITRIDEYPLFISVSEHKDEKKSLHFERLYWPSNNVIIKFSTRTTNTGTLAHQENKELLLAYLEKYPPTWEVTEEDLDPHKLLKDDISRFMDIALTDMEEKRVSPKKLDQFEGMLYQCQFECYVRGLIKNEGKGCPITFIMNQEKREKKFKEFKELALDKKIDLSKVQWHRLYDSNYGQEGGIDAILKKLNMTKRDIPMRYYTNYAYEK